MQITLKPIAEVNAQAMELLNAEIGVVDTMRFISQFRTESGDYTAERGELLANLSHRDIVASIKRNRRKTKSALKSK